MLRHTSKFVAKAADDWLMGISCLLLTLFFLPAASADDAIPVIHKAVSEVQLAVVATDRSGRPVSNLSPAEVSVIEDGRPVRNFDLRSAADIPLRVGIVLDLSDSMQTSWPSLRTVLAQSLQQVLRPEDQVLLLAFDNKIELEQVLAPAQKLDEVEIPQAGGLTALYDTLYAACHNPIFSEVQQPRRSALIVFSDGEDNLSRHDIDEAIESAESAGIAVYSISAHPHWRRSAGDSVLRDLAAATGGRNFVTTSNAEIQTALFTIRDELRASYLLYYRTVEPGSRKFRHIDILPTTKNGPRFRSRAGYYVVP